MLSFVIYYYPETGKTRSDRFRTRSGNLRELAALAEKYFTPEVSRVVFYDGMEKIVTVENTIC